MTRARSLSWVYCSRDGAMFLYQAAVALTALGLIGTALLNFWCFRKPRALVAQPATPICR